MRARRSELLKIFERARRCERGSASIEFAIAGSLALALIFAIIDVSRAFIVTGLLSDAVRQVSRENQVRETPFTSAEFSAAALATVTSRAAGMLEPANVVVSTTVYDSFDALASNQTDSGAPPGGEPGQIVKYRLTYTMDYYTPFVGMMMEGAQFDHAAEIIVYNEPENPT